MTAHAGEICRDRASEATARAGETVDAPGAASGGKTSLPLTDVALNELSIVSRTNTVPKTNAIRSTVRGSLLLSTVRVGGAMPRDRARGVEHELINNQ